MAMMQSLSFTIVNNCPDAALCQRFFTVPVQATTSLTSLDIRKIYLEATIMTCESLPNVTEDFQATSSAVQVQL